MPSQLSRAILIAIAIFGLITGCGASMQTNIHQDLGSGGLTCTPGGGSSRTIWDGGTKTREISVFVDPSECRARVVGNGPVADVIEVTAPKTVTVTGTSVVLYCVGNPPRKCSYRIVQISKP
jgi:hypothetical protein